MQTKTCKYCNKEINVKAEICPHCGCRVKSNIFRIIIVCIVVIIALIGAYMLYIKVSDSIRYNKIAKEEQEKRNELVDKFIGNYSISSSKDIIVKDKNYENPIEFKLLDSISFNKKNITYINIHDYDSLKQYDKNGIFIYKEVYVDNSTKLFMQLYLNSITKDNIEDNIYNRYICFELVGSDLQQTRCNNRVIEDETLDLDDFEIKMIRN